MEQKLFCVMRETQRKVKGASRLRREFGWIEMGKSPARNFCGPARHACSNQHHNSLLSRLFWLVAKDKAGNQIAEQYK